MTEPRTPPRFENRAPTDATPVEFDIVGWYTDGSEWTERFRALPVLPASAIDHLSRGVSINDEGDIVYDRLSVVKFIREALIPEDEQRFRKVISDKRRMVRIDTLGEIMTWLAREFSAPGEPSGLSWHSGPGGQPGGSGSPATSTSPGGPSLTPRTGGPSMPGPSFG